MRLTPLDIRKQEFEKGFRGYEVEEVQSFLQMLSSQWEEVLAEQRRLESRVRELESKLQHYTNVEEALQEALRTARETSRTTVDAANQKAADVIAVAEREAERIRADVQRERTQVQRVAMEAGMRRDEIVARLRAFLNSELEVLARYEAATGQEVRSVPRREATSEPREPARRPEPTGIRPAPREKPVVEDESQRGAGWTKRPVVAAVPSVADNAPAAETPQPARTDAPAASPDVASPDELERIRRILNELD